MTSRFTLLALIAGLSQTLACNSAPPHEGAPTLGLKSASFSDAIPDKYSSCVGQDNVAPELSWQAPPASTQSFVLLATDRDSPLGFNFVHWVLYDLPADKRELP